MAFKRADGSLIPKLGATCGNNVGLDGVVAGSSRL